MGEYFYFWTRIIFLNQSSKLAQNGQRWSLLVYWLNLLTESDTRQKWMATTRQTHTQNER
jgi:hypothetical protein